MTGYKSGKCNIGAEDAKTFYYSSLAIFLIVASFVGMVFYFPQDVVGVYLYVSMFFVTLSASISYLQARNSFCTGLALRGKEKTGKDAETVDDSEDVRNDRKKALVMFGQSAVFSAVLIGLTYLAVTNIGFLPALG